MKLDASFDLVASIALTFFFFFPKIFHFVYSFMVPRLGNPFIVAEFLSKKKGWGGA